MIFSTVKKLLVVSLFLTYPAMAADDADAPSKAKATANKASVIMAIEAAADKTARLPDSFIDQLAALHEAGDAVEEEALLKILERTISICSKAITPEEIEFLKKAKKALGARVQDYKAEAFTTTVYGNKSFIVDNQYPILTFTYKNAQGKTKKRTYKGHIQLAGLTAELALRINAVFLTDPAAFNFQASDKTIELGTGIEIFPLGVAAGAMMNPNRQLGAASALAVFAAKCIGFVYIPFTNIPGGMVMITASVGLGGGGLCLVRGGTLTPVESK